MSIAVGGSQRADRSAEGRKLVGIPLHPARVGVFQRLDVARDVVFVLKTRGCYLELQRAYGAENRLAPACGWKQHLHQAFLFELTNPFVELFEANVAKTRDAEMLRRES